MNKSFVISAGIVATLLTACGGSDDDRTPTLAGTIDAPFKSSVVCIDDNRNFACDPREPIARVNPSGRFEITIKPGMDFSQVLLAATVDPFPNSDTSQVASRLALAAPATGDRHVGALSTLVALRMLAQPGLTPVQAAAQIDEQLGLTRHSVGRRESFPDWQHLESASIAALTRLTAAQPPRATEKTPAAVIQDSASALTATLKRYIDPATERLLKTVDGRTLASEIHHLTGGTTCAAIAPIPQLRLNTEGGQPIISKDLYLSAKFHFVGATQHNDSTIFETEIKGRGNSTWDMPKKPYRLKLKKKAELLGLPEVRSFALLANYADKSLLRTAVALCLAKQLDLEYTPSSHFVELYLNNEYQGVYQLTDKTYALEKHLEDNEVIGTANDPDPDDGFLLELDSRLDEELWFRSDYGIPYTVQIDSSPAQRNVIMAYINDIEKSIFDATSANRLASVASMVDLGTLIDFYIVNELTKNRDAFWSSTFVHRLRHGKLKYGPIWDFDLSSGNDGETIAGEPLGWWLGNMAHDHALRELIQEPEFATHLKQRWDYLLSRFPETRHFIASSAEVIEEPQKRNFETWDILDKNIWPYAVVTGSYAGEINHLSKWLDTRTAWISQQLREPRPWID